MKLKEQMFKMISDWFSSKQIKQEFLKDKAITAHKFNYWIRKYQDQNRQTKDFDGFKEIEIPEAVKSKASRKIEITIPSGFRFVAVLLLGLCGCLPCNPTLKNDRL